MKCPARVIQTVLACAAVTSAAHAQSADPCDFVSSGASSFSYEQVKRCYESVPFEPSDLVNIIAGIEQQRSFSDLAEVYDARVHWREALAGFEHDYPNDLAMHDALKREHHEFRNVHVSYFPPNCYSNLVIGFTPFEYGSAERDIGAGPEQIIFVESALLAEPYRAATGIDAAALIGQRIVSINGVPVLDYFRAYVEGLKIHRDAGGGLNGVLASDTYSIRINGGGDYLPDRPADDYVLESIDGQLSQVTLPWVYVPRGLLQPAAALPLTDSTEAFVRLCQLGPQPVVPGRALVSPGASPLASVDLDDGREDLVRRLRTSAKRAVPLEARSLIERSLIEPSVVGPTLEDDPPAEGSEPGAGSFYEVPPEQVGQDIEVVIPTIVNATVLDYDHHVTALQLLDTNRWIDVARRGIEYACDNSDRLIIDLRGNNGGNDTTIRWLHHYLFPEGGQLAPAGLLALSVRTDNPAFTELLSNAARFMAEFAPGLGLEPCTLNFTPGCLTDVDTGEPLLAGADWVTAPTRIEERAGVPVSLSRKFAIWNVGDPEFDSASCAGRFQGDDLVFITDGRNASGGYFLPAAFEGEGVIVSVGGFLGEAMAMGRAAGGASLPFTTWTDMRRTIDALSAGGLEFEHELVQFTRPVTTRMEFLGAYRKDGHTLHVDDPVPADLHVNVWTDLPGSDGYVYERVLQAVDAAAAARAEAAP